MASVETPFAKLARLTKQIHELTDQANTAITELETDLRKTNFGVEIWLDEPLAPESQEENWDDVQVGSFTANPLGKEISYRLGWARCQGDWGIVSKRVTVSRRYAQELEEGERRKDVDLPQPLINSPRLVRIAALPLLDTLFREMIVKAELVIAACEAFNKGQS